jgi:hypothetical protein
MKAAAFCEIWKQPARFTETKREIDFGIVDKRLGEEGPGVVDQGIDAAESVECSAHDALGGAWVGDVTVDGQDALVAKGVGSDRPGIGHDAIAALAEPRDEARADPLRCTGDNGDLRFSAHAAPRSFNSWLAGNASTAPHGAIDGLSYTMSVRRRPHLTWRVA